MTLKTRRIFKQFLIYTMWNTKLLSLTIYRVTSLEQLSLAEFSDE